MKTRSMTYSDWFYLFFSAGMLFIAPFCSDGIMNVGGVPLDDTSNNDTSTYNADPSSDDNIDTNGPADTDSTSIDCSESGTVYQFACWYLGEGGESCIEVCATHGGYSDATSTVTGTPSEGGDWEACRDIFRLMGFDDEVGAASRLSLESEGLGCHIWEGGFWWLIHPDVNPDASYSVAERVCACMK